jgi:hypothetical protein
VIAPDKFLSDAFESLRNFRLGNSKTPAVDRYLRRGNLENDLSAAPQDGH